MSAAQNDRKAIVLIQLADAVGLLLREQEAAIGRADDAIGVVGALPGDLPRGTSGDDARNLGESNSSRTLGREAALLRDYDLIDGDSRSNGIADHEHEEVHGFLFSPIRFNCAECQGPPCMLSINGA